MRRLPLSAAVLLLTLAAALGEALAGCSDEGDNGSSGSDAQNRQGGLLPVAYEELALSTPQAAVESFADAFETGIAISTPTTTLEATLREGSGGRWLMERIRAGDQDTAVPFPIV